MPVHLPGFHITETLFNNEQTAVHRAIREEDGTSVILKQLVSAYPTPGQISRFSFSYEVLSKFDHPNIVKAFSWYSPSDGCIPTMVLEDNFGIDLFSFLNQFDSGFLPVDVFLNIAIQLAEAISVIHYHQVIHKDLHPGNILVTPKSGLTQVTDFGLASLLSREQATLEAPEQLEGVLAYISPEQTGRMNRALDYRTDFYTMGATFYHLLSGAPPFSADDALGMVHSHIAKKQEPLVSIRADIPQALSDIIDKLLNKTAEDRYQSALGLKKDLEKIRFAYSANKDIPEFPLGMEDISDRFQVPQKLYGRENDVTLLMRRFFQAAGGKPRMLAVAGYSGIGKSALVHEVHKPIAAYNGLFCSGKFDQFQKNIPYSALQTALRGWIRYTLSFSEKRLLSRRQELKDELGVNARVLVDFMPEFELVLGELEPVAELAADETQNRFHLVFQQFIKFITQARPLVLFIDDIQWADRGTLNLLPLLLSETGSRLLVIVAYRNNEVDGNHPAMVTLDKIKAANNGAGEISELELGPLDVSQVSLLIQDAVHRPECEVNSLVQLVFAKTAGNPFFIGEFLKSLYTERLLDFNLMQQRWVWNLEEIKERDITDNVVDLMLSKMHRLPEETQSLIQLAACVGSRFDLDMLARIAELPLPIVARKLWPALSDGLLLQDGGEWHLGMVAQDIDHTPIKKESDHVLSQSSPMSPQCRFLHDRMLQAAYQSMSEEKRQITHLRVGRLLLKHVGRQLDNDICFAIVAQLNKAISLITSNEEKDRLSQLNLRAAKLAWKASVWEAAAGYAQTGISLLPENHWKVRHEDSKSLYAVKAECEYLRGNPDRSEDYYHALLSNLKCNLEKAEICSRRIIQFIGRGFWSKGKETGVLGLRYLGFEPPSPRQLASEVEKELALLKSNNPDGLIRVNKLVKDMTRDKHLLALQLYSNLTIVGWMLKDKGLGDYCTIRGINFITAHGKSDIAAMQLTCYAQYLKTTDQLEKAYMQAEQAKELALSYTNCREVSNCFNVLASMLLYLQSSYEECMELHQKGFELGLENGEIARAAMNQTNILLLLVSKGASLNEVQKKSILAIDFIAKKSVFNPGPEIIRRYTDALQSTDKKPQQMLDETCFDIQYMDTLKKGALYPGLIHYRVELGYWSENYESAWHDCELYERSWGVLNPPQLICFYDQYFYYAMLYIEQSYDDNTEHSKLESVVAKLRKLAELSPKSFEHKYLIIKTELGKKQRLPIDDLCNLFRDAINSAKNAGFVQFHALSCELFGKFWLNKGFDELAAPYLREALNLYRIWGCANKVALLIDKYDSLYGKQDLSRTQTISPAKTQTKTITKGENQSLDLASAMKSAQAISSELQLKKVAAKVLEVIIESTGATYGSLITNRDKEFRVQAQLRNGDPVQVLESPPLLEGFEQLPENIISLVLHSGKQVNISDLLEEKSFSNDPYLLKHQPRSVLCVPVIYRDDIAGALYLENNLTSNTFTPLRLDVINLLLSQAAISFENAELFDEVTQLNDNLERKVEQRTQELNVAVNELKEANEGLATFSHSVSHDLRAPLRRMDLYIDLILEDYGDKIDDELLTMLRKIHGASDQMGELISGLLTLAQVQRQVVNLESINLSRMVEQLCDEMRDRYPLPNVDTYLAKDCYVLADRRILTSIMENLISNAWKYSSKKDHPTIAFGKLSSEDEIPEGIGDVPESIPDNQTVFYIRDNGAGFDMNMAKELFGTFKRFHSSKQFEGTGIGLSTVKRAVEKHGGCIWANAVKREGATFYFTLPHG